MPISYSDNRAIFSGNCRLDEAEALRAHLEQYPDAAIDMAACEQIHTVILQILLSARATIAVPPADAFLQHALLPHLRQDAA